MITVGQSTVEKVADNYFEPFTDQWFKLIKDLSVSADITEHLERRIVELEDENKSLLEDY